MPAAHSRPVDAEKRRADLAVAASVRRVFLPTVHRYAVAHLQARDTGPHRGDRAAQFVAEDHRRLDDIFALKNMDVGSTDARVYARPMTTWPGPAIGSGTSISSTFPGSGRVFTTAFHVPSPRCARMGIKEGKVSHNITHRAPIIG